jgi:MYXO-CTERM domain-containing protein
MRRSLLAGLAATLALAFAPAPASAQQDQCPPGSTWKTKDGAGWCEPSVCDSDAQCSPGEICRPVPLCVEIGKLDPQTARMGGDAGTTLMARQRCGENKSCPQTTVCSEKDRCISKSTAEKMGLLAAPAASAGAAAPAAKKSSCGCDVPGVSSGEIAVAVVAGLALIGATARRRRRTESDRT